MVELALSLTVLMFILLGVMEMGVYISRRIAVSNAAREGARAAALGRTVAEAKTRVQNAAPNVTINADDISLHRSSNGTSWVALGDSGSYNDAPAGQMIRVTVSVTHTPVTGFIPGMSGLSNSTFVVMEREQQ
jgi:Flp pilus assembly protein TadG